MVQTVTFPGLGWELELNRVAFSLFGMDFYWYGLLIAIGFICAITYATRKAKTVGLNADAMTDVVFGATIIGVIGARLYYVAFNWEYYSEDLTRIFDTRRGGLAIYGGIIFGFLAGWLLGKWKKVRFLPLADVASGGFLIAQSIGRWGNFFNEEAHGIPTDLPWAQIIDGVGYHPTFLYESIWCFGLFWLLSWIDKYHRKFNGQIICLYGILYSVERFFVEGLRTDSLMIGPLRQAQVISLTLIAGCAVLYYILNRKHNNEKETL